MFLLKVLGLGGVIDQNCERKNVALPLQIRLLLVSVSSAANLRLPQVIFNMRFKLDVTVSHRHQAKVR